MSFINYLFLNTALEYKKDTGINYLNSGHFTIVAYLKKERYFLCIITKKN